MSSPSQEQGESLQPIEPSSPNQQGSNNKKPVNETPAQEAARLRRERRNAKIQSGGSARLDAISRLSGRREVSGEGDENGKEKDANVRKSSGTDLEERATGANEISSPALDPDVSVPVNTIPQQAAAMGERPLNPNPNHDSNTNSTNPSTNEPDPVLQAMRQMLAGQDPASDPSSSSSSSNNPTSDPTTALLTALLGGSASEASGASGTSFDTQQSNPAQSQKLQQNKNQNQRAVLYWRLIHALIFFSLALHFVIYGHPSFNGTKVQRDDKSPTNVNDDSDTYHDPPSPQSTTTTTTTTPSFQNLNLNYWLVFLALELALQSGRFVLGGEEGINASSSLSPAATGSNGNGNGSANIMALLLNFLPPPWAGYVKVSSRYWYMFRTVKADVLMFVFVLGVGGWLRA